MSEGSKLEGDMWPDSMNPEKVQIQKIRSNEIPEVQALLKRKENYWSARAAKGLPCRDGTGAAVSGDGQPKKNSRGEKRRAKKDKKLLAQQAAADKALQESNTYVLLYSPSDYARCLSLTSPIALVATNTSTAETKMYH